MSVLRWLAAFVVIFLFTSCASNFSPEKEEKQKNREVVGMKITSSVFVDGGLIPLKYTCDGDDVVPPLLFLDVPVDTKSLSLVVDDPDAPRGTWDHWILWDISPNIREVKEGEMPHAVYGKNSARKLTWHGPCPPDREHRYFFKLYALDSLLSLPEGSTKTQLEKAMQGHILAQAVLMGRYNRLK